MFYLKKRTGGERRDQKRLSAQGDGAPIRGSSPGTLAVAERTREGRQDTATGPAGIPLAPHTHIDLCEIQSGVSSSRRPSPSTNPSVYV